jgi:hypothetical protein
LGSNVVDPFRDYPDFRANLWLKDLTDRPTVIPDWRPLCHAIFHPWGEDTVVMKPLDRVSEMVYLKQVAYIGIGYITRPLWTGGKCRLASVETVMHHVVSTCVHTIVHRLQHS